MSKCSGIYKIQSISKPERVYIGSAVNIANRWKSHLFALRHNKKDSPKLQNHYNKYGKSDLVFTIVEECDRANLLTQEQYYIDTLKPYFNICKVAGNCMGVKCSDKTKKKISKANKGNVWPDERKKQFSKKLQGSNNPNYGHRWGDELKAKLSNKKRGCSMSLETKEKISQYNKRNGIKPPSPKGRVVSEDTKKKLREVQLKRWEKPGERERMSTMRKGVKTGKVTGGSFNKGHKTWNKGKPNSEEAKRKMKEAWVIRRQRKAA